MDDAARFRYDRDDPAPPRGAYVRLCAVVVEATSRQGSCDIDRDVLARAIDKFAVASVVSFDVACLIGGDGYVC